MLLLDTVGIAPERVPNVAGVWYADRLVYQDSGLTTIANSGDPVGGWSPVQGVLPAFSQSAGKRPTRQGNAVVFDGVDDVMSYASNTLMNAASRTVIAVASAPAMTTTQGLFSAGNAEWYVGGTGSGAPSPGRMISSWEDASATQRTESAGGINHFDGTPRVYAWRHTTIGASVTVDHWRDVTLISQAARADGMNVRAYSTWYLGAFASTALFGNWTLYALTLLSEAASDALLFGIIKNWRDRFRV